MAELITREHIAARTAERYRQQYGPEFGVYPFGDSAEILQELVGDVEVIIKPFYDEPAHEVAAVECINVVEGKSQDGVTLWIDRFEDGDPRVVTRVHVF